MKPSARYTKIVEWSEEDQCYIGSALGLIHSACHGNDEKEVFAQLCVIVEEWIEIFATDGDPLPPASLGLRDRAERECAEIERASRDKQPAD